MKKILFNIGCAFAATLLLGACSDTESVVDNPIVSNGETPENAIAFSTYMGKSEQETRAGATGAIDTDTLKGYSNYYTGDESSWTWNETAAKNFGFGVFAYYTGTATYDAFNYNNATQQVANFMYNQQVWWNKNLDNTYITKWTYSPVKYWPNEISGTANTPDDDQDDDKSDNPATGSGTYGGNVSFFAYAPYVDAAISAKTDGIVAINGATTLAGDGSTTGNAKVGDPTITYIVASSGKNIVDLLWGTKGNNGFGVTGNPNTGSAEGTATAGTANNKSNSYIANLLSGYKTNTDLTKQTTTGTIGFVFKHALAKVGGSGKTTTTGSTTTTSGLMVMLDIDDMKGAETGGTKDDATRVTINSITISAKAFFDKDNDATLESDEYMTTQKGIFNLATGQWEVASTDISSTGAVTNYIINTNGTGDNVAGELETSLKEPSTWYNGKDEGDNAWSKNPEGVLVTPKPVYANEANPLVFIPGSYPELTVTVDYLVRTKDGNLKTGYSAVEQIITKKLTFTKPVELNKQYSLLMRLGLTSVKFDATVSEWDNAGTASTTDGDPTTLTVDDVESIYLPINVSTTINMSAKVGNDDVVNNTVEGTVTNVQMSATENYWDAATKTIKTNQALEGTTTWTISPTGSITSDGVATIPENGGTTNKVYTITATNKAHVGTYTLTQTPKPLIALVPSEDIEATATSFDIDDVKSSDNTFLNVTGIKSVVATKTIGSGVPTNVTLPAVGTITEVSSSITDNKLTVTIPANTDTSNTVTYVIKLVYEDATTTATVTQKKAE